MKKLYKWTVACLTLLMAVVFGQTSPAEAAGLSQSDVTIPVGGKVTLRLKGEQEMPVWTTSDRSVARVGSKGVVTGVQCGSAVITAKLGTKSYSCKVTVNQTYWPDKSQISLKNESAVTITFTKNEVVTYKIQDKAICSARWGSWEGNDVPLYITPKKVGVTYITCSNRANSETIRIRVKVTGIPVEVTNLETATSDGGDFVYGLNTAVLSFRQSRDSKKTTLYLISDEAEVIKKMKMGAVRAGQLVTASWDGKTDTGEVYDGRFRVKVIADGYTTRSWSYTSCYARSPFTSGNGTEQMPYEVTDAAQLKQISGFNGRQFVQTADIDLRAEIVDPLFDAETPFTGKFDGMGGGEKHRILNYSGTSSLFGAIGTGGTVMNLSMVRASVNGSDRESAAILAETNKGLVSDCEIIQALIYASTYTDAAVFAVENEGVINRCTASGMIYTYGSMGGIVVNNRQRVAQSVSAVGLCLSADSSLSAEKILSVGGIAGVNEGRSAVLDACVSDSSVLNASGNLPGTAKLYMGGMVGRNYGQVLDGSFLGQFPPKNTEGLSGTAYAGIVAGENSGILSGTVCYSMSGRSACAISNGHEYLTIMPNPAESALVPAA